MIPIIRPTPNEFLGCGTGADNSTSGNAQSADSAERLSVITCNSWCRATASITSLEKLPFETFSRSKTRSSTTKFALSFTFANLKVTLVPYVR